MCSKRLIFLLLLLMPFGLFSYSQTVKVACIGNSVTFGYGLKDPGTESYPSVLQGLLGQKYEVKNFGLSGATLLKKGHRPYFKTKQFEDAMAFKPDIAIVHLGLNDTDPRDWPEFKGDFEADYAWLLDTLRKQNPNVKLFVCKLTPIFNGHPRFKSGTRDWYWQIQERIVEIAKNNNTGLINLTVALYNRPDLFADNLHPDKEGAAIIAKTVYGNLTGNYGGLKLPEIFTDHMVLQRNKPIKIYGIANSNEQVKVIFNHKNLNATADSDGKWKVQFPEMQHGGPYELTVQSGNKTISLTDILVGDVWLCSGQSNMSFPLSAAKTGKSELAGMKLDKNIRLFKLSQYAETNDAAWDAQTLQQVNQLNYFSGKWTATTSETAADFSAVGYYFGKKVSTESGVPVGLIQLAVGGSTIESWVDRYTMEHDEQLVDVLTDWRKSDFIQEWARGRADVNLKEATNPKQRHPYEPIYNYEAGIAKLTDFPIKGVIWYQGESNAQNVDFYEHTMPILVDSWRKKWGYNFPFYYVQLSSIDRPSWPYFRDAQRKLLQVIPNSGMVVSSDVGDSLNVHPNRKMEVGERLAILALKNTYRKPITANGPIILSAKKGNNNIVLSFTSAKSLSTQGGARLVGFQLVNRNGFHLTPEAVLVKNQVILKIPKGEIIREVQYAYQPFTRANLVNEAGLPASTFSIPLN
ncbi:GDSL-type esterase/lipase family protein [Pedobacter sp. B4-66]|uniref:GDSL-type esterase/lipase family protein n=1 Tax=Pedobacter sp. B4-66 TaxID=2817280 RepID=UPI001BDA0F63|nr:GDSL-type esterase/lipase family protein [Pedobacter sp. B4-66]